MKNREIWDQFSLIQDYCKAGYRKTVVSAVGLSLLDGVRPFITTVLLGLLIDGVYAGASFPELLRLALTALGLECLCYCLSSILTEIHNQKHDFIYEQQNGLLNRRLLFMNYPHLEEAQTHTLLHTIRNAGTDHGLIGLVLDDWKEFLKALTAIVSALVIAFPLFTRVRPLAEGFLNSWLASLLLFAVIAGLVYFSFRVDIRYGKRIRDAHKKRASDESLLEHYMGIFETAERQKDLRLYGQQELIGRQTDEASGRVQKDVDAEAALAARGELLRRAATALIGLLVYLFAGLRAFLGLITIGSVVTYAAGIVQMSQALADLMQVIASVRTHAPYCHDYVRFRKLEGQKAEGRKQPQQGEEGRFHVEFDHVSFRYPGSEEEVLRDLNLSFDTGRKLAIVGKNGSGKTTFIKLLCRLYEPARGCIRVNGTDIREYDADVYNDLLAVVFQDFRIFSFEVGENIAGSADPDEKRVWDALDRAGLTDRAQMMERGLHTFVGKEYDESGVNFSGGERQKMAIARAIYKDAPFVIMDEPTAALDPVSEYEVYAGFDQMIGGKKNGGIRQETPDARRTEDRAGQKENGFGKAALYISHRLASCRFCQDILVFDGGRVIQRGSHEQLIGEDGLYRQMWDAQAQYYKRPENENAVSIAGE